MPKIIGRNAYVYIGGQAAPERNQVTINLNREMQEARVFSSDAAGASWSDQIPGFRSWTININGYYDSGNTVITDVWKADGPQNVYVYETRTTTSSYWYGQAYFTLTEEIGVDNVITLNLSGTGTGPLTRVN